MKTVVSKTGVEVLYPCSIHLLTGEILECEYKSDQIGYDLMDHICDHLNLLEKDNWGFRYLDSFQQRCWLDLNKLVRPQLKNLCPIHLMFRVKVYAPEPYKLEDVTKNQIFMQLCLDLKSGRLCCGISDAALLLGLILQYQLGDYNPEVHFGNYVKKKFLQHQSFVIETKAIAFHKDHLVGINGEQTIDLFLRLASQLLTYGVDPFLIEDNNKQRMTLWVNYRGMETYVDAEKIHNFEWMDIAKVKQVESTIFIYLLKEEILELMCLTKGECNYIYSVVVDHLKYFTTTSAKSTTGIIGSDSAEYIEEEIKIMEAEDPDKETDQEDLLFTYQLQDEQVKNKWALPSVVISKIGVKLIVVFVVILALCIELYFYRNSLLTIN